jgi:hypothetical protein
MAILVGALGANGPDGGAAGFFASLNLVIFSAAIVVVAVDIAILCGSTVAAWFRVAAACLVMVFALLAVNSGLANAYLAIPVLWNAVALYVATKIATKPKRAVTT